MSVAFGLTVAKNSSRSERCVLSTLPLRRGDREIDRGEDRRKGGRLRLAGQGQSKEPAGEYPNGVRRAGCPPCLV
jgi:hypothetical protein